MLLDIFVAETTRLYTFIGQLYLSLQLHGAMGLSFVLVTCLLCLFNYLAYIFHTTIAHFNRIPVKYFM